MSNAAADIPAVNSAASGPRRVPVPLTALRRGQRAVLMQAGADDADGATLRAMGLRPDCQLRICRTGRTCIVAVETACGGGCRIGLDRSIADRVLVTPA